MNNIIIIYIFIIYYMNKYIIYLFLIMLLLNYIYTMYIMRQDKEENTMKNENKMRKINKYHLYNSVSRNRFKTGLKHCKNIYHKKKLNKRLKKTFKINLLTNDECKLLIHDANEAAKNEGWLLDRHANYPTTDLEIKNIVSSSIVYSKLNKIYDVIQAQYNVPSNMLKATDLFLVRYDSNLQNKLKKHKDGSEFSFIIALNENFTGGGTCINKTSIN